MAHNHIILRRATSDDASALSSFAARSFQATYGPESKPSDMEAYLTKAFSPAAQAAEIADGAATVILAVDGRASAIQLAGYAHLVTHDPDIELKRLYVDVPWKGCGLEWRWRFYPLKPLKASFRSSPARLLGSGHPLP